MAQAVKHCLRHRLGSLALGADREPRAGIEVRHEPGAAECPGCTTKHHAFHQVTLADHVQQRGSRGAVGRLRPVSLVQGGCELSQPRVRDDQGKQKGAVGQEHLLGRVVTVVEKGHKRGQVAHQVPIAGVYRDRNLPTS